MIYLSYIACKGTIKRAEIQENLEFSRVETHRTKEKRLPFEEHYMIF